MAEYLPSREADLIFPLTNGVETRVYTSHFVLFGSRIMIHSEITNQSDCVKHQDH